MKSCLLTAVVLVLSLLPSLATARDKTIARESLERYIQRMQQHAPDLTPTSPGSIWTDNGRFSNMAPDYKAVNVGDLITILIVQDVQASNAGSVATDRKFNANSGVDALAGHVSTSGIQSIFSPHSTQTLSGKSQASTTSSLRTSMTGRVVAMLPSGVMVVEAERQITMNNERQTLLLRGLVRPGDISPRNVASNSIANLELELKGKGVLSDGTRPPNAIVRWLLRIVGF